MAMANNGRPQIDTSNASLGTGDCMVLSYLTSMKHYVIWKCLICCWESMQTFVDGIDDLPEEAKASLRQLSPSTYIGNAAAQAKDIKNKIEELYAGQRR
ncbi:hypothetical protein M9435_002925 [Picochlorum sp. BPE23]|nr:hypothetical protein M9435_002923 [Picochlorum sp. BPE23]KAI8107898.1 hypothetical protein M9435_002925 [Picochlorum sp. BPE23]